MTEERKGPTLGVHFKEVSVFKENQWKWMKNQKEQH